MTDATYNSSWPTQRQAPRGLAVMSVQVKLNAFTTESQVARSRSKAIETASQRHNKHPPGTTKRGSKTRSLAGSIPLQGIAWARAIHLGPPSYTAGASAANRTLEKGTVQNTKPVVDTGPHAVQAAKAGNTSWPFRGKACSSSARHVHAAPAQMTHRITQDRQKHCSAQLQTLP
jgi:hypothetical protein